MPPRLPARLAAPLIALCALPAAGQPADEVAFARAFLGDLQIRTVVENREYCGYFGRDPAGKVVATRPRRGKWESCLIGYPPEALEVFASYHTHAALVADSYNEIPSPQDLRSDIDSALDGYVSTPGGRLWFSDHRAKEVRQICGEACLPQDPAYRPGKFMKVRRSYSLEALDGLMGGP
jgi:hypothetical protein